MYFKGLAMNQALNNHKGIISDYAKLAALYGNENDWQRVEEMFLAALKVEEASGNENMVNQYAKMIALFKSHGNKAYAEALLLKRALEIEARLESQKGAAEKYAKLATFYMNNGKWKRAEEMFLKELEIYESSNNKAGIAMMANKYAQLGILLYKDEGDLQFALEMFLKELALNEALEIRIVWQKW